MKVLVTGGSGFIGSNLIDHLLEEGHEVINLDIRDPRFKQAAKYIKGDILKLDEISAAFRDVEFVIHLAAEAKVGEYFNQPVISSDTNIMGTIKVLEAARINGVKRVIFASTEWVYSGVKETNQVDEETKIYPPAPPHLYSSSKIAGEMALMSYQDLYKLNYTIMRFGIPFGERAWADTVTPIFLRKIFSGQPITVRGEGDQFRQFVYVKDLARGIACCLKPGAENQIINLNGTRPITIMEIARTIESLTGLTAKIESIPDRPGDFKGYLVSSVKAEKLIGWKPKYDYREAMKGYIEWFKKNELGMGV